jgi:hypothetical protein
VTAGVSTTVALLILGAPCNFLLTVELLCGSRRGSAQPCGRTSNLKQAHTVESFILFPARYVARLGDSGWQNTDEQRGNRSGEASPFPRVCPAARAERRSVPGVQANPSHRIGGRVPAATALDTVQCRSM